MHFYGVCGVSSSMLSQRTPEIRDVHFEQLQIQFAMTKNYERKLSLTIKLFLIDIQPIPKKRGNTHLVETVVQTFGMTLFQ